MMKLNFACFDSNSLAFFSSIFQVEIDVNLCFCSEHTCNHPEGELVSSRATPSITQPGLAKALALSATLLLLLSTVTSANWQLRN